MKLFVIFSLIFSLQSAFADELISDIEKLEDTIKLSYGLDVKPSYKLESFDKNHRNITQINDDLKPLTPQEYYIFLKSFYDELKKAHVKPINLPYPIVASTNLYHYGIYRDLDFVDKGLSLFFDIDLYEGPLLAETYYGVLVHFQGAKKVIAWLQENTSEEALAISNSELYKQIESKKNELINKLDVMVYIKEFDFMRLSPENIPAPVFKSLLLRMDEVLNDKKFISDQESGKTAFKTIIFSEHNSEWKLEDILSQKYTEFDLSNVPEDLLTLSEKFKDKEKVNNFVRVFTYHFPELLPELF